MKKSLLVFTMLSLLIFSFPGCATFPQQNEPAQSSNLTYGMVKISIIKGKTTQAEILHIFGAPNIITKNSFNDEVWNYNRMSFKTVSGSDNSTVIFWSGSRAVKTSTTKSFDLILIFDNNDIVKDYSIISAQF